MAGGLFPKIKRPFKYELTGRRFGRLTVVDYDRDARWNCVCDCGERRSVRAYKMLHGLSKSCGCLNLERMRTQPRAKLEGQRFGRLLVVSRHPIRAPGKSGGVQWNCICDCGETLITRSSCLVGGRTRSCGCWAREKKTTHSQSGTRTYYIWSNMLQRCYNRKAAGEKTWKNYGGRGIRVCERWSKFANFYADMGKSPEGHTLDRVDVNGNYESSNCVWIPRSAQSSNTRRTKVVVFEGQEMVLGHAIKLLRSRAVYKTPRTDEGTDEAPPKDRQGGPEAQAGSAGD